MKYVTITGASSGIGRAAAKAFAKMGKNLILIARREKRLLQLKEQLLANDPTLDIILKIVDLSIVENVLSLYKELKFEPNHILNKRSFLLLNQRMVTVDNWICAFLIY